MNKLKVQGQLRCLLYRFCKLIHAPDSACNVETNHWATHATSVLVFYKYSAGIEKACITRHEI